MHNALKHIKRSREEKRQYQKNIMTNICTAAAREEVREVRTEEREQSEEEKRCLYRHSSGEVFVGVIEGGMKVD